MKNAPTDLASIDLTNWSDLYTVTASSETESFMQMAIPLGTRVGFYRIVWEE